MERAWIVALAVCSLFVGAPQRADAQTRLGVEIGTFVPLGDLGDALDASPWFGGRVELQKVNALGQVAAMSFVAQGGYSPLEFDGPTPGTTVDGSYFEVGAGARVYSMALPFFLSAGLAYSSYDFGAADSQNGFTPSLGAGVSLSLANFFLEFEARGRVTFLGDEVSYDPRFMTFSVAAGLPF